MTATPNGARGTGHHDSQPGSITVLVAAVTVRVDCEPRSLIIDELGYPVGGGGRVPVTITASTPGGCRSRDFCDLAEVLTALAKLRQEVSRCGPGEHPFGPMSRSGEVTVGDIRRGLAWLVDQASRHLDAALIAALVDEQRPAGSVHQPRQVGQELRTEGEQ